MFVATINKTLKSYLFAIIGAEYVMRWLPIGTHDWEKFIKPNDLILAIPSSGLHSNGFSLVRYILKKKKINFKKNNYLKK